MKQRLIAAAIVTGMFLLSAGAQAQSRYSISDLSGLTPPGATVRWVGINDSGGLVGTVGYEAATYAGGQLTIYDLRGASVVTSAAINNAGSVVYSALWDYQYSRAYTIANGTATLLPTLTPSNNATEVRAINNAGVAVGSAGNDQISCGEFGDCKGQTRAVVFANGKAVELGSLAGHTESVATAINNRGAIVGFSGNRAWGGSSFIYENGTMRDLNVEGDTSYAVAINDAGQVAGTYWYDDERLGSWLIDGGRIEYFGLSGTQTNVKDLNNAGQMIGNSISLDGWGRQRAWIRENGEITMLDELLHEDRWSVLRAYDMNEAGQILAEVKRPDGQTVFALLTPDEPPVLLPVPEPGTYAMLAGGLGVMALWRRRAERRA